MWRAYAAGACSFSFILFLTSVEACPRGGTGPFPSPEAAPNRWRPMGTGERPLVTMRLVGDSLDSAPLDFQFSAEGLRMEKFCSRTPPEQNVALSYPIN